MRRPLRDRPNGPEEERLFDLMRERAIFGLGDDEQSEMNRLAARHSDVDVECYDRAAAALDIVFSERRCAPMPKSLASRIAASAPKSAPSVAAAPVRARPTGWVTWTGWVAAAAATILAIVGWTREPSPKAPEQVALELQREVDAALDHLVLPWKPTEDPDGRVVKGELHWSTALQKGYMRFRGLPSNDPREKQYQLWIFDKPRGTDHPVDGGVFDVAAGEVVIPIDAKIRVSDPALFAVTAEPPGGVVVSKREHIVSLAQL